jgi:hypothetical protein
MEPQTLIDVQCILDRKRKRTEYDKQRKLKRKIDSESLTAIDVEYVLCNSYNSITVEMNRCGFRSVRFALLYIVTRSKIV